MKELLEKIGTLSKEECEKCIEALNNRIYELNSNNFYVILDKLKPYLKDKEFLLCQLFKGYDAPYELCELSFIDVDNDIFDEMPKSVIDEVQWSLNEISLDYIPDADDLYPGESIDVYVNAEGDIREERNS